MPLDATPTSVASLLIENPFTLADLWILLTASFVRRDDGGDDGGAALWSHLVLIQFRVPVEP